MILEGDLGVFVWRQRWGCVCVCGETAVSMWVCVATVVCGCRWKQVYVCRHGFVPVCVYGGESGRIGVERRTEVRMEGDCGCVYAENSVCVEGEMIVCVCV